MPKLKGTCPTVPPAFLIDTTLLSSGFPLEVAPHLRMAPIAMNK